MTSTAPAPPPPNDRFLHAWALYAGLVVLVFLLQIAPGLGARGMLESEGTLARELHSVEGAPWGMGELEPYRYRPLFRAVVLATWRLLGADDGAFYGVFVTFGALALLGAVWAFDALLQALGFTPRQAMLGGAAFLLGFPVLFAYDIPIQTREDLLGYAWIALGLLAVTKERLGALTVIAAVAPAIRETCLLGVLPYALVSTRPWRERVTPFVAGAFGLLLVRIVQTPPGGSTYDYVGVSTAPTLQYPGEALLYLFATFGALWLAAGLRLADPAPPRHPLLAPRVALLALAAVALTGWTMGMVREARITYVLFPFVIPLALDFALGERARAVARCRPAWLAGALVLLLGLTGIAWLRQAPEERVPPLHPVIGENFNPGSTYVIEAALEGSEETIFMEWPFASPWNGPVVLLHLAASAFLGVGAVATRRGAA